MKLKPEVQKEISRRQEKQLKVIFKQLSGSDRKSLTEFLRSGQAPGSKAYKALKPNVQKSVLKLNLSTFDIILKRSRNPITKFRVKMAKVSYQSMLKAAS